MGYVKWSYDTLNTFCHDVFRKFGFNEEETNIIKDVLLTADLYGIESHGMQRMVRYDKGIEKGTIHPDAKPEVVFETPVSAVIDGHDGMGQLISHFAMEKAIEKAKKTGVGFVSVRNSIILVLQDIMRKWLLNRGCLEWHARTQKRSWYLPLDEKQCLVPIPLQWQCRQNLIHSFLTAPQQ